MTKTKNKLFMLLALSLSAASAFADTQPMGQNGDQFAAHKAQMLQRMDARKQAMQTNEDCLRAATTQEQAKACHQAAMAARGGMGSDHRRIMGGMN